jgi:hypothetical protein
MTSAPRAFDSAIDRRRLVRLYGGPDLARPTCQVLPPGIQGYRRYCPSHVVEPFGPLEGRGCHPYRDAVRIVAARKALLTPRSRDA